MDLIFGTLFRIPALKASLKLRNDHGHPPFPKVSIIFAARNEELKIRDAVISMLGQNYPNFEVIAVNDRSNDETLSILKSISAARDSSHFHIVNVNHLPEGWLGKTHALYQGFLVSSGEWLLFTDADVHFNPETLSLAITAARERDLDHLVLWPNIVTHGFIEALFINSFSLLFNLRYRPWAARDRYSLAYIGVGSFNLLKRNVYENIGTHQKIALEVADDMMLGKSVKRAGFRQMIMNGQELLWERWVEGFQGVIKILEKNAFAGLDYNFLFLMGVTVALLLFDVMPFFLIFFAHSLAFYFLTGTLGIIFMIHLAGQKYQRLSLATFPAHPFGSLLMLFIIWQSALTALKTGGIRWRDTFYPLESLKKKE